MFFTQRLLILILLMSLHLRSTQCICKSCIHCDSCSKDVINDNYLDTIDSLLKQKFKDLQYATSINKVAINETNIKYQIIYNNNMTLNISLDTQARKILILSYSNNNQPLINKFSSQCTSICSNQTTNSSSKTNNQTLNNQSIQNPKILIQLNPINQAAGQKTPNNINLLKQVTSNQSSFESQTFNSSNKQTCNASNKEVFNASNKQTLNSSNPSNSSNFSRFFYMDLNFNFSTLKVYNFSCQTQKLISQFLCRKYYGSFSQNNIKLINFKSYGLFSRLIYFINYGKQIKGFQIVVRMDNNNSTISIISFKQITDSIHVKENSIFYDTENIYLNSNSNSQNNSTNINGSNSFTTLTNNSSIGSGQNLKFYVEISNYNSLQVKDLQKYLSSIFYKTYSKLTLIKVESQFILKQNTPYKQFTSYRLTFNVKKFETLIQAQPLFYQLILTKTITTSSTIYDIISAMYINLLPLKQVYNFLLNRNLSSIEVKIDQNIPFIDAIITKQFQQQLGNNSSIFKILRHEPYYQLTYKDLRNKDVVFMILYDVVLNNIQFYKNDNINTTVTKNQIISQNSSPVQQSKVLFNNSNSNSIVNSSKNNSNSIVNNSKSNSNSILNSSNSNSNLITSNSKSNSNSIGNSLKSNSNSILNGSNSNSNSNQITNNSNNKSNSITNGSNSITNNSLSLLYLSKFINDSSGTINIPINVSSTVNYSKFVQIKNYSKDSNVIQVVNYILKIYGTEINNFMKIKAVYSYENIYQLMFEIRRFQNINAEILIYQLIVSLNETSINVVSSQYVNNYVHRLDPTFLSQNLCFDSSSISTDLYLTIINRFVQTSDLMISKENISLKNLLEGTILKSVGRYLPFYIFSYSNGVGVITYYDVLNKKIQILYVNQIKNVSNNIINNATAINSTKNNTKELSNQTIYQQKNNKNIQARNNLTINTQISNDSINKVNQNYTSLNKSQNVFVFQNSPTLSIQQIQILPNISNKINSLSDQKVNLINRNQSNQVTLSNTSNVVIKQIGISVANMIITTPVVCQIASLFLNKVNQLLYVLNITKYVEITKSLINQNRLKSIDQSQPLILTFKSCSSNPYFSTNQTDYRMLSKLMTYSLLKQKIFAASEISSIKLQLILETIFKTYKRFVLLQTNTQTVYEIITNNQFVILSFRKLRSFYQLTADPHSNYFNISLSFDSQMEKFQTLKIYADIITKVIPVSIVNFKQIHLKLVADSYKYIFSYFTKQANNSQLLWLVTEIIINVERQTIQVISHKIVPPLKKQQLNIVYSNLIKNQNRILPSFITDEDQKYISSIIDYQIQSQNQLIFQKKQWKIILLELYTIKNDFLFIIFLIKYKKNDNMIELTFKGKFNIPNKYIMITEIVKDNDGFSVIPFYSKGQFNISLQISSILNKGKQIYNQLFHRNLTNDNYPQCIQKKMLYNGQNIYVLLYNTPMLYQITLSEKQSEIISLSYINEIQTSQYYDELTMPLFRQIRVPQIKFYSLYNNLMTDASKQFKQLNKSTILALFSQESFDLLTYRSIYQYNSQLLVFQIELNKTSYQKTNGYNKSINIMVSGYSSKNCKTQNNQGYCTSCANSNGVIFQLQNGRCYQTIINCKNQLAYKCYSCFEPYQLINNTCMCIQIVNLTLINNKQYIGQNSSCISFDSTSNKCIKCQLRFYLNNQGGCSMIQPQCNTYDQATGKCQTCKDGFNLNINTKNCQQQTKICKSFNTNGKCYQCPGFQNYILFDGVCYPISFNSSNTNINSQNIQKIIKNNVFCQKWSQNKCFSCFSGTIINQKGICQISNLNCLSFDFNYQKCNVCSRLYTNINGRCVNNS